MEFDRAALEKALELGKRIKSRHVLGHHFETDDIVASALRSVWGEQASARNGAEAAREFPPGHLRKKICDKIIDHYKRESALKRGAALNRVDLSCENTHGHSYDPEPQNCARLDVRAAVERLERASPKVAKVLRALYFEELSQAECATREGISLRTVERLAHEGRCQLGELLESLRRDTRKTEV
ncbi:MAG: hypothetical protein KDC95_06925 [Planctomycetes bacterium]|nr:hypothetical protein [Planctomycetota bacterium]